MKFKDAFEKIIKGKVLSIHKVLQHLAIVGFPFLQASFRREELNESRIVLVIIGIPDMVELAAMLHNLAIQLLIRECHLSELCVHQSFKVVQVTSHSETSRLRLLEFLIQQECFLQECP